MSSRQLKAGTAIILVSTETFVFTSQNCLLTQG